MTSLLIEIILIIEIHKTVFTFQDMTFAIITQPYKYFFDTLARDPAPPPSHLNYTIYKMIQNDSIPTCPEVWG